MQWWTKDLRPLLTVPVDKLWQTTGTAMNSPPQMTKYIQAREIAMQYQSCVERFIQKLDFFIDVTFPFGARLDE